MGTVIGEMSFLFLGFLLLQLSNGVEQARVEEGVNDGPTKNENGIEDQVKELMQRVERMDITRKMETADLEKKLEAKNTEVENLEKRVKEIEAQKKNQNQEIVASLKSEIEEQCQEKVKSEVENVLPTAVEKGLRDLPFEMVCAYQEEWKAENSIVPYDRLTLDFNNSDRPGGADGSMNIETGVFTTVTSGYYIVTFGGTVYVHSGEFTVMYLYHNGVQLEESKTKTQMATGNGDNYIGDQASKTVILHLLAGDTLDLRTENIGRSVYRITLCVYMAPAPYGI